MPESADDRADRLVEVEGSDSLAPEFAFVYDARGQRQIELQGHKLLNQNLFFDRDYDAVGNPTKLEANIGGWVVGGAISGGMFDFSNSYSYDRMDRLISVNQSSRSGTKSSLSRIQPTPSRSPGGRAEPDSWAAIFVDHGNARRLMNTAAGGR